MCLCHFTLACAFGEVLTVIPQSPPAPAPFGKGAFLRPVSFYCAISDFFNFSIDSVGTRHPKIPQTKTGA